MKLIFKLLFLFVIVSCQNDSSQTSQKIIESTPSKEQITQDEKTVTQAIEKSIVSKDELSKNEASINEIEKTTAQSSDTEKSISDIIEKAVATKPMAKAKTSSAQPAKIITQPKPSEPTQEQIDKTVSTVAQSQPTLSAMAPNQPEAKEEKAIIKKLSHSAFDALLKKYVSSTGVVDYAGLKRNSSQLQSYLGELAKETPKSSWSRNEKLAYWINAYNAFTLDLIVKNHPVKSITDLDGGSPWKVKRIELERKKYSLDQIENQIIRPQFKEPRIHFAVNCAAVSCPTLLNEAFLPEKLNGQLEKQTRKFINNSNFNQISESSAKVSKIFEWYGEDFGDLKNYLNKYSDTKIGKGVNIEFGDYDWALNGK